MSDKISDVITKLEGRTTIEDFFIEYGTSKERIRIIDALVHSDLDNDIIAKVTNLIRETK